MKKIQTCLFNNIIHIFMTETLLDFTLNQEYLRVKKLGDKLAQINELLDWGAFQILIEDLYTNKTDRGGRPNIDEVVMIKMLFLQEWYGLSDPELERQATDRISFRHFLGFPETIPDHTTIWYFRERLAKTGKDKEIWFELQYQLNQLNIDITKGAMKDASVKKQKSDDSKSEIPRKVVQDATFINADPGHAKADKPRGNEAKTRRSKDGTWVKKGVKSYFGFKLHTKQDLDTGFIKEFATTNNKLHDSQIDLSEKGEVVYRDKAYFGVPCKGYNATMKKGARDHPIDIRDKLRNKRISRIRSPGERPYAVIKNVFKGGHTRVTTLERVDVKMMMTCFCFNVFQLLTIVKLAGGLASAI